MIINKSIVHIVTLQEIINWNSNNKLYPIIKDIELLDWIRDQLLLKNNERDFNLKIRQFSMKEDADFNYQFLDPENAGRWYSFEFAWKNDRYISLEVPQDDYTQIGDLKIILFLFWRLVVNNFESGITIKIGLRALFEESQIINSSSSQPKYWINRYVRNL